MAASLSYVGEDEVIEILSRLSVKSLLRLKCVCRSWYALIKSSYFITKHLQRNIMEENNAPLFVVTRFEFSLWWISSTNNEAVLEEIPSINLDLLPPHAYDGDKQIPVILGPVNGLYCATSLNNFRKIEGQEEKNMVLFNPALREFKAIPEVPYPPITEIRYSCYVTLGFGYDSRTSDFKLVVVVAFLGGLAWVFVYTLSSNSWRKIDCSKLPAVPDQRRPGVFVSHGNGVVHWLGRNDLGDDVILSFDLGTEVFRISPLPDTITPCRRRAYLTIFKDSVVAILSCKPPPRNDLKSGPVYQFECYFEIWVMKDYGVKESWTRLHKNIGPLLQDHYPLKIWKNGEILFLKGDDYKLVSYDPSCQQTKDLHIANPYQVAPYMESLVSINGSC